MIDPCQIEETELMPASVNAFQAAGRHLYIACMVGDILDCTKTTLYPILGNRKALNHIILRMENRVLRIDGITEHKKI